MTARENTTKVASAAIAAGALAAGKWLIGKFGERTVEAGFDKTREAASNATSKRSDDRYQRTLAQDLARAHGWRYTERTVIDHCHRYVVWDDDNFPSRRSPRWTGSRPRRNCANGSNSK